MRRPRRDAINISSALRPHLCLLLDDGIFMKGKYLQGKSVSQRLRGERGGYEKGARGTEREKGR